MTPPRTVKTAFRGQETGNIPNQMPSVSTEWLNLPHPGDREDDKPDAIGIHTEWLDPAWSGDREDGLIAVSPQD